MTADDLANSWWFGPLIFFALVAGPFILIWIWVRLQWWNQHRHLDRSERRHDGWCDHPAREERKP